MPSNTSNHLGDRGESVFKTVLTRLHGRKNFLFEVIPLGEKKPSVDFLVELCGHKSLRYFFFVQVKTTHNIKPTYLQAKLSKTKASTLSKASAPCYLVAIDEKNERGYIRWIDPTSNSGISRVKKKSVIGKRAQKALVQEVKDFWNGSFAYPTDFTSKFK